MEAARENIGIQKWVAALSVLILLGKLVAYYLTHSVAILTDALESIVNVVAGFLGYTASSYRQSPETRTIPTATARSSSFLRLWKAP